MERDLIGEAWDDIKPHIEDELRSKAMAKKFNPYRQVAGDKQRVWSQVRTETATIAIEQTCKQCSTRFETLTFVPSGLCPKCSAKKESK